MVRVAKFHKVSRERFQEDMKDSFPDLSIEEINKNYEEIILPKRATKKSAGYDFYSTLNFKLKPGESIKIPTGIRAEMNDDFVLCLFPRSGLGFKYRLQLNNTVGIIDSDYFESDNEGHIMAKITNDSKENKAFSITRGTGFMQGIFLQYGITIDDEVTTKRNGGFGSTSKV